MTSLADLRRLTLRGRSVELQALEGLVDELIRGRGGRLLIEGEVGIGKTRLIDELELRVAARPLHLLRAAASSLESDRPFGVLSDVLGADRKAIDPELSRLGHLLLGEAAGAPEHHQEPQLRYRIVETIIDLMESLAIRRPTLVVLEDIHWADAGTCLTLHRLTRTTEQFPLAIVATMRPTPRHPPLREVIDRWRGLGTEIQLLHALREEDLAAMTDEIVGVPPDQRLADALGATAGNPLFASELIASFTAEGLILRTGDNATLREGVSLPRTVALTILQRLAFLQEEALRLLRLASILGASFLPRELAVLTGQSEVDLLRSLDEPLRAGILVGAGDALAFRHEVVRDALYEETPAALRTRLHALAGDMLIDSGAPRARAAPHVALGAEPGDERAIIWLRETARMESEREPGTAVGLLQRTLELLLPDDPRVVEVQSEMMLPLMWARRLDEAEALARGALERCSDRNLEVELRTRLGQCHEFQGRPAASIEELARAAAVTTDGRRKARLLAAIAYVMEEGDERAEYSAEASRLAVRYSDETARVLALMADADRFLRSGEFERGIDVGREALDRARRGRAPEAMKWGPHQDLAPPLLFAGRVRDAQEVMTEWRQVLDREGAGWHEPNYHCLLGVVHFFSGLWDEAVAELEAGLSLADQYRVSEVHRGYLMAILVQRNQLANAQDHLDRTHDFNEEAILWGKALLHEAEGKMDPAVDAVEQYLARPANNGGSFSRIPDLIRISLGAGEEGLARKLLGRVQDLAGRTHSPRTTATESRCRGLVETDAELLLSAVTLLRGTECKAELFFSCEDAGASLLSSGRREQGVELIREAMTAYTTMGAERLVSRCAARLRESGVRLGSRAGRTRSRSGPDSLTETELRVATLIAEGLTNKQIGQRMFISKRTVETHVSNLFRKMDVQSRTELITKIMRSPPQNASRAAGRIPSS